MPENARPPVEILLEQLHGTDWNARCDAARLLGQSRDPRAVDALLPDLNDKDWRVRRNAAQALGALRDKRAVEPLLQTLNDRTMTVRQRAIVALGRIKDPRALPALLEIALQNKHESYDAAKAVGKFGKKAAPEVAKAFEKNRNEQLLLMLVQWKSEGVFDLLIEMLESPQPSLRMTAIRQLGKLGDKRAIPYLLGQLKTEDPLLQSETVHALSQLKAVASIPALLALLTDDELYGPRSSVYHAVMETFQNFGGIANEIRNAFPGKYPSMFNMGGAALSLPEAMGLLDHSPSSNLFDALTRFQKNPDLPVNTDDRLTSAVHNSLEEMDWKFGVMFADARDAKQEHIKCLVELLASDVSLTRTAAALSLPWYGEEKTFEPLTRLVHDPDEQVRLASGWAARAVEKVISYRNKFGM